MSTYDDNVVRVDDDGITIKSYRRPGAARLIPYESVRSASLFELGPISGRHRLVGFGFARPRHFFHWDRRRADKTHAIGLDVGRLVRPVITPDDPDRALAAIDKRLS